jgi:hypothetical protein
MKYLIAFLLFCCLGAILGKIVNDAARDVSGGKACKVKRAVI